MIMLTFDRLHGAVAGDAVALRSRMTLQPAGGDGDKVFPPSYAVDGRGDHKYAVEERQVGDGDSVSTTVLLDSVASQANRAELALLEGWERGELPFPVPYVDFSGDDGVTDYDKLTVLEAPHRLADAIFRDSLLDGTLFRLSEVGRAITDATPRNATDLFRYSPTSLLFGMWDSTGPKGGLGSKFQRAYVSEIVGLDAKVGNKVGGRIDPLQITKVAPEDRVFNSTDPNEVWTPDPDAAERDKKGDPAPASRGSGERRGWSAFQDQPRQHRSVDKRAGRRCNYFERPADHGDLVRGTAAATFQGFRSHRGNGCPHCNCGAGGSRRSRTSTRPTTTSARAACCCRRTPRVWSCWDGTVPPGRSWEWIATVPHRFCAMPEHMRPMPESVGKRATSGWCPLRSCWS